MKNSKNLLLLCTCIGLAFFTLACILTSASPETETSTLQATNTSVILPSPEPTLEPSPTTKVPRTINLNPEGTGDYPDLPSAVADLMPGSTIILAPGNYNLSSSLQINNTLTIQGAGSDRTALVSNHETGVFDFFGPGKLVLNGISFVYNGTGWTYVGEVTDGEIDINDCKFSGGVRNYDQEIGGNGLFIQGSSTGIVRNSVFFNNDLNGVSIVDQSNIQVETSTFESNGSDGLGFWNDSTGTVRYCISKNNKNNGFSTDDQAEATFEDNFANNNTFFGFAAYGNSIITAERNESYDNEYSGFTTQQSAYGTFNNNYSYQNFESGFVSFNTSTMNARNNQVYNNGINGFSLEDQTFGYFISNVVFNNEYAGVYIADDSYLEITANEIYDNGLSGLIVRDRAFALIEYCNIYNNLESAIAFFHNASGDVNGNTCSGNQWGISVLDSAIPYIGENNCP